MATSAPSTCAICDNPASHECPHGRTSAYCSKECQAAHKKTRKIFCLDLELATILERAADIVQKAYINFRESTWDTANSKVEIRGDEVMVYDEFIPHRSPLFIPFPNHLMKNEGVKEAVLTFDTCNEPLVYMEELFQQLLHDCTIKVQEVGVNLKHAPRRTTVVFRNGTACSNWPTCIHEVLRVTSTESGKAWYVDISGGQYGISRNFWAAEEYLATYVKAIKSVRPFGSNRKRVIKGAQWPGIPGLIMRKTMEASTHINKAIAAWVKTYGMSLAVLVRLLPDDFESLKQNLLAALDRPVRAYVRDSDFAKEKDAAVIARYEQRIGKSMTDEQKEMYLAWMRTAVRGSTLQLPSI